MFQKKVIVHLTASLGMFIVLTHSGHLSGATVPGIVHHWRFDETSGDVAADSVSANSGTLKNWGSTEPRWVDGMVGGALDFGNINNYVITDSPISFNEYTIAFWLKVHAVEGTNPRIVGPNDREHWIIIGNEDQRGVGFYYNWGGNLAQDPNPPLLGTWEHYAIVFDRIGGDTLIYRDGVEVAHKFHTDDLPLGQWIFGHSVDPNNHGDSLSGQLDDLQVYDRLLAANEIATLAVPEPSALILLTSGLGALGLIVYRRRRLLRR